MKNRSLACGCVVDDLRRIGVFGALPDDILAYLCASLSSVTLAPGETIFREGENGRDMFVILAGEFEVTKLAAPGHAVRMALLGIDDWFGEMSLLDVQPRSATVKALAPSRLLRIGSSDLDALYRRDTKAYALVVLNLARGISRRLRVTDGVLANFVAAEQRDAVA